MDEVGVTIEDQSLVSSIATGHEHAKPDDDDGMETREQTLAVRFLCGVNEQHASYLTHLRNSYLDGYDNYPSMLHDAYNILQHREPDCGGIGIENDGVAFMNAGQIRNKSHITCLNCGEQGHMQTSAPSHQKKLTMLKVKSIVYTGLNLMSWGFHSHSSNHSRRLIICGFYWTASPLLIRFAIQDYFQIYEKRIPR
jgi:hypothetical protein